MTELEFVDKFVKKYNLDNILQKDLNYGFYFILRMMIKDYKLLNEHERALGSNMDR